MGGWGQSKARSTGLADEDGPNPEKVERRRQADIRFITWVRACRDRVALGLMLMDTKVQWRIVCLERRLRQLDAEGPT